MTYEEIAAKAEALREELGIIPDPSINNYRSVISSVKQVMNDFAVLIRNLAQNLEPPNEV
jgi:hypothetical protein